MTDPSFPLKDEVVLVTGASRGIGRAIAVACAHEGARVAVNFAKNEAAALETAESCRAAGAGGVVVVQADVGSAMAVERLVDATEKKLGPVSVLVNNAAVQQTAMAQDMSDAQWDEVIGVNLSGVFRLCRRVLPGMLAAKRGRIVNVASASAFMGQQGAAGYVASKHGLIGLTRALAMETAKAGVLINAVAPGLTDTDLVRALPEKVQEKLLKQVPLGRLAAPDEVAELVVSVITRAGYSTGNVFHCSGGVIMA